ncbi:alpha/beta fold hydrolase [Gilvimarinus xylanilyticus]|uniref:Alpha/beta hydrolase n=1 Tax=Gilvimarinus xylanilyticus TaxID=2944139 RepID=A0A9X2KTQ4_9GAMM|nr:alpha/beta hydrolase [Gilvimarinus xylanilyticus]
MNSARAQAPDLPDGWHSGYATETVYNSRVFWVEAGKQHKETVILIHGLGQKGWRDWRQLIPPLAEEYRVLAIDLPGFGRSDKPAAKYSPENYARVLDALVTDAGIGSFRLIGHSMGGNVALRYATRYPQKVQRLVLISAAGILERSTFAQHSAALPLETDMFPSLQQLPPSLREGMSEMVRTLGGGLLRWDALPNPDQLLNASDATWATALQGRPNLNAALALVQEDYSRDLTDLQVPSLILWGEDDPVTPLRTGQLLDGQIPDSQLITFTGMGHMPLNHPDQVYPPLQNFLHGELTGRARAITGKNHGDYHCHNQNDLTLTGHYRNIRIEDCNNIKLENLKAQSIYIRDANVSMLNVSITAPGTGLQIESSNLQATNLHVEAQQALVVSDSHIDIAGGKLTGTKSGLSTQTASRFVFSVSQIIEPSKARYMHGVYKFGKAP